MDDFLIVPFGVMRKSEISSVDRFDGDIRILSKQGITWYLACEKRECLEDNLAELIQWVSSESNTDFVFSGEDEGVGGA